MKTLSEAVQLQIIEQAFSTYRNVFLAFQREGDFTKSEAARQAADVVAISFANTLVEKLKT